MKKISLILALLLVLLLASCGTTAPDAAETTEASTQAAVSAEEAGFTLEDVVRQNGVRTLVSAYGGVQAMHYENDELYSETYYFMYAGKIVSTRRTVDAKEDVYSCTVDNDAYDKVGDHLQFSYNVDKQTKPSEDYLLNDVVTAELPDGSIERYEEPDKETWLFEMRGSEPSEDYVCRCTVEKQTLTIRQIDWTYGDGTASRTEYKQGAEVMTKEFGMLDGFAQDLRTVTCVCTLHDKQGKPTEKTYKVEVPYNVEPVWESEREINVYLDKELTKAYKYPGNGEGYTVYVTDAMG